MIATAALVLSLAAADPRPALVELQLDGRTREALDRVEQELAARPETARQLGLDYLRGHLLVLLGREQASIDAFSAAMSSSPLLLQHGRYRLALVYDRTGHPEMAAGLVATTLAQAPASPLARDATALLVRTLARGGDCKVLNGIPSARLRARERRRIELARADCAARAGQRARAASLWADLLEEDLRDETARQASDRLLQVAATDGRIARLVGLAFHQHREFGLALEHLRRALGGSAATERERSEARYALARSHFWEGRYPQAAAVFGELAGEGTAEDRARALYQQGRCYELMGQWQQAVAAFRLAVRSSPDGEWAAPALLSAMRLDWRAGDEAAALATFAVLASRPEWREPAGRGALFLASSDVTRRRADRARDWLAVAERGSPAYRLEAAYWRGRGAELLGDRMGAVRAYLEAMRADLFHPLAQSALARLAATPLAAAAAAEGRRLAGSSSPADLYGAWLLLGDAQPAGRTARARLLEKLLADQGAAPHLRLASVPIRHWPFWSETPDRPEEVLLGLGLWHEAGTVALEHFPTTSPSLAFTGSQTLARAGAAHRSFYLAGILRDRTPPRVPLLLQPLAFRRLLYPLPWDDLLTAECRARGVDPLLLAAVLREESRFDPDALSPAAARGLAQLTWPTARRVAGTIQLGGLEPDALYRPEVSIAIGAAYMGELLRQLDGAPHIAIAAYNAGVPQARLWRSYCYSAEPEEYFSKVGFEESRGYVRKVLTSWAHYRQLYGSEGQRR